MFLKKLGGSDKISIGFHYFYYVYLFSIWAVCSTIVRNHEKPCPLCGFVTILLYSYSRVKIPFSKHSFITHRTSTPFINYAPPCRPLMMYKKKNKLCSRIVCPKKQERELGERKSMLSS